jgi:hypothetical protein
MLVLMQGRAGLRDLAGMGKVGWLVASLLALGMVCFIPALQRPACRMSLSSLRPTITSRRDGMDVAAEAIHWRTYQRPMALSASSSSSAMSAPCRYSQDRPRLPDDICDRGDDGRRPAAPEHADGGRGGMSTLGSIVSIPSPTALPPSPQPIWWCWRCSILPGRAGLSYLCSITCAIEGHPDRHPRTPLMPLLVWLAFQEFPPTDAAGARC